MKSNLNNIEWRGNFGMYIEANQPITSRERKEAEQGSEKH